MIFNMIGHLHKFIKILNAPAESYSESRGKMKWSYSKLIMLEMINDKTRGEYLSNKLYP